MINFKTKEDVLPSALILLSLVLLTAALVFTLLVPEPTTADIVSSRRHSMLKVSDDILYARKRADEASQVIDPKLWTGTSNHVSASVLALVTATSLQHSLTLTAFRPQRSQDLDGITELPYTVQLAGTFPDIRAVALSVDGPKSKVVLRSFQVNSSEENTGTVTATLVISAYIASPTDDSTTTEIGGSGNGQA